MKSENEVEDMLSNVSEYRKLKPWTAIAWNEAVAATLRWVLELNNESPLREK